MKTTILLVATLAGAAALAAPPEIRFEAHTIATGLTGGYHVAIADLNGDGKPDIIALAAGLSELVWYENPGWQRHVIVSGRKDMINLAVGYIHGVPRILLAEGFSMNPAESAGNIWMLHPQGDPRQPWEMRPIDRLPTSHRLRAGVFGSGNTIGFVNAPLAGPHSTAPDYRDAISLALYLYSAGSWKRELISTDLHGVLHGIYVTDWDGDGRDDFFTASFEGIHLFLNTRTGWVKRKISAGDPSPWPKCGSSDVTVVKGPRGRELAAIEPWHGNQVVIYHENQGSWSRQVIDSSLEDGHTLVAADFDGDGDEEVVAGFRKGHSLVLYHANGQGGWTRRIIDERISATGCAIANLNASPHPGLVCIGSATADLVWYENVTGRP
ncbi:MAG: VCBS repeat-containing protein [Bryobacteraceae bacterium]